MPYQHKRIPDIARLGTSEHRNAVKNTYRRCMKFLKQWSKLRYDDWDWLGYNCRIEFEKYVALSDAGEVTKVMNEVHEALDIWELPDTFFHAWDGYRGCAFNRYPIQPKKRFEHRIGLNNYDSWWVDKTTDEYFGRQEIEKWRARYIMIFRDCTLSTGDYAQWLSIKKRLESELKVKIEDIQRTVNKSATDYLWDWPYNCIYEFSDGWKPSWNLDAAFMDHWDEELWRHMAELTPSENQDLKASQWQDSHSLRSIDRFLTK